MKRKLLFFSILILTLVLCICGFILIKPQNTNFVNQLSHTDVGYSVSFGNYRGHTEWLVIAVEDDRTLLLSKDCVDFRAFDSKSANVSWENSDINTWLNGTYYKQTFSKKEKDLISDDGVFLLSADEVNQYFYIYLANTISCIVRDENDEKVSWWLRTTDPARGAYAVAPIGSVSDFPFDTNEEFGVRPAVWVNIPREKNSYIKNAKYHYVPYADYIKPADDKNDNHWKIDYQIDAKNQEIYVNDSKMYQKIFGFSKPTKDELYAAVDTNPELPEKYRDFIKSFINDWLALYPESDLSVLKHNLSTLHIFEFSKEGQSMYYQLSGGAIASYMPGNNCIYIVADADIQNKGSEDYVTAVHELIHAARNAVIEKENGDITYVSFNSFPDNTTYFGDYQDEALVSYFSYELQNLNHKSSSYAYLSSMYRQFMPYLNFDGADYMNHSAAHFVDKLQEYFDKCGIRYRALSVFKLMDLLMISHEEDAIPKEWNDYTALYESLSLMRQHEIGYKDMSAIEKEAAFEEFWADLNEFITPENNRFSDITKEDYLPFW